MSSSKQFSFTQPGKRKMWLLGPVLFLLIGLAAAAAASLLVPYQAFPDPSLVVIERGSSVRRIGEQLAEQGILRWSWQLQLARVVGMNRTLQAGEYRFSHAATPLQILDRLARGDVYYRELRIPEGYNMFEIAKAVSEAGLGPAEDFLKVARNPAPIRDLAPQAPSLEGFLFPSTYHVSRSTTPQTLAAQMVSQFRREWTALQTKEDVLSVVTLASLVEKETSIPDERPLVAGVYAQRLRAGMKLDADPTTAYAALLAGTWRGTIYRSDLDRDHPYNTYRVIGLPPGPIANPGLASLRAALKPVETTSLFFVAKPDGSGGHIFSKDLNSHTRAVAAYRREQQKTNAPAVAPGPAKSGTPR